jgi:hypothetical protein
MIKEITFDELLRQNGASMTMEPIIEKLNEIIDKVNGLDADLLLLEKMTKHGGSKE